MDRNNNLLEAEIKNRFNDISDKTWFSEEIEKDNFQYQELLSFFEMVENKQILEIGCAKGRFCKRLVENGAKMTGVDLSDNLISKARENVPQAFFMVSSATSLPFKDGTFDYVYSIETFEHIPDTEKAVFEACRVLKDGGKIIIIDKHRCGLNPDFLVPNFIWKPLLEKTNRWMYPNSFLFKEKYFVKKDIDKYLSIKCKDRYTRFLPGFRVGPKSVKMAESHPLLVRYKVSFAHSIYKLLPFLSHYISWKWVK